MTKESLESKNTNSDEISLKQLIIQIQDLGRYFLSKRLVIILFLLAGGGLGLGYSYFKKPIYTATTTFVLEDEKGTGLGGLAGLASIAGVDLGTGGGGIFQGENILQLYRSRTMLEQTLLSTVDFDGKKQMLVDRFIEFNELKKKWEDKPELVNLRFSEDTATKNGLRFRTPNRLRDSILGIIVLNLNENYLSVAKPDKKVSTIQVSVTAKDELFAKAFNDELVKKVNEFYINTKTKKTLQNVRILQHKTDSVRAVMNGAIYTAVAVIDATPNLNPTRQIKRMAPSQTAQFSAETNKAILAEMVKNLEMTKMSLLKETPLIQVIDQPVFPLTRDRLGKIKGTVFGMILGGFIISFILIIRRILKRILS